MSKYKDTGFLLEREESQFIGLNHREPSKTSERKKEKHSESRDLSTLIWKPVPG